MKSSLLLDLAGLLDEQLDVHPQRRGEGHVALAALVLGVLRLAERVVAEAQLHAGAGEVRNRRDFVEQLAQASSRNQSNESSWIRIR